MSGTVIVTRWEIRRLFELSRVRAAMAICLVGPWLFEAALHLQNQLPKDTLFGLWVHTSGWAIPLVMLGFAGTWAFPILAGVVAGGSFAGEDEAGFWAPLMTRSRTRNEIFTGKAIAACVVVVANVVVLAVSSSVCGIVTVGDKPLVGVSGNQIAAHRLLGLVAASWLSVLPAVLGFAAIAIVLSVLTRSSVTAVVGPIVVGLLMQLDSLVAAGDGLRHSLLSASMTAWDGLFGQPAFEHAIWRGVGVSAAWFVVLIAVAAISFARREFSGA